jgi:putative hydrolase of HD superfamily
MALVTDDRLARQIEFVIELDRLKGVLRRTTLMDGSRRENSAEHSWHLALMALILGECADEAVDVARVIKMLLLHDVVEIDAGDTFCYDQNGILDQTEREERAAQRVFGLLPADQAAECRALWEEFEEGSTAEARFAVALDRLQPLLSNIQTRGGSWAHYGITLEQVETRMAPVASGSTPLAAYVREVIDEAVRREYIRRDAGADSNQSEATAQSL